MDSFEELDLDNFTTTVENNVGIFRIDRPPANAHNIDVLLQLQRIVETVRFDEEVRCAVFGSESDQFFSTGFDIKVLRDEDPKQVGYASQTSKEVIMKMKTTDTVFVAMVDGHCMGGGLELALGCDFRFIGDDDDYNVGMPEINLGLIAGEAGTQLLPRTVGRQKALKMTITGETLTPQESYDIGLFDEIHPPDDVEDETISFAEEITELPHGAVGHNKLAINEGMEMSLWDALAHERELQNRLLGSPSAIEGTNAFLDKREPEFKAVELGEKEPGE
jgi:enoyl-CoA hydratase/carnithine racemase